MQKNTKEKTKPSNLASRHSFGARGNFTVPKRLLRTARDYGLEIKQEGHGTYRYEVEATNGDLEKLCPPLAANMRDDNGRFSREGLLTLLHFARQPMGTIIRHAANDDFRHEQPLREAWRDETELTLPLLGARKFIGGTMAEATPADAIRAFANHSVPFLPKFQPFKFSEGLANTATVQAISNAQSQKISAITRAFSSAILDGSVREKRIQKERYAIHQVMRFITTGNTIIPKKEGHGHLECDHNECHEVSENATREEHNWAHIGELGRTESAQVTVPNTSYDPKRGFLFKVHPDFAKDRLFGEGRNHLRDYIIESLRDVKGDASLTYQTLGEDIVFNAAEIQKFSESMHRFSLEQNNLDAIAKARKEDLALRKLRRVPGRSQKIQQSKSLRLLAEAKGNQDVADSLDTFLATTTFLSTMLKNEHIKKAWKSYRPVIMQSPAPGIQEQLEIFQIALEALRAEPGATVYDTEALVDEFFKERGFMQHFVAALDDALQKVESRKKIPAELKPALAEMRQYIDGMQASLKQIGISNIMASEDALDKEHEELLKAVKGFFGRKENLAQAFGRTTKQGTKDGIGTVWDFFIETMAHANAGIGAKILFLTFVGIGVWQVQKDRVNTIDAPEGTVAVVGTTSVVEEPLEDDDPFAFLDDPLETQVGYADEDDIPEKPKEYDDRFHIDMRITADGVEFYKHFVGGKVVQLSQGVLNGRLILTDKSNNVVFDLPFAEGLAPHEQSKFYKAAFDQIQPTTDVMLGVNILQNISHAGYWTYTLSVGAQYGPKAMRHLIMFFGPIACLGLGIGLFLPRRGRDIYDMMKRNTRHAERLDAMFKDIDAKGIENLTPEEHEENMRLMTSIMEEGDINLDVSGIKHSMRFDANMHNNLLTILAQNEILMDHIGPESGLKSGLYTAALRDNREHILAALDLYEDNKDLSAFETVLAEHLEPVLAANMHFADDSAVIEQLDEELTNAQKARMARRAKNEHGALNRLENRKNRNERLSHIPLKKSDRVGVFSVLGAGIANGVSHTVDGVMTGSRAVQDSVSRRKLWEKVMVGGVSGGAVAASVIIDSMTAGESANFVGQDWAPVVDAISDTSGDVVGTAIPVTAFMGYNYVEDILLVHIGGAAGFVALGYVGGKVVCGHIVGPSARLAAEYMKDMTGIDTAEATKIVKDSVVKFGHYLKENVWGNGISRPAATALQKVFWGAEIDKPEDYHDVVMGGLNTHGHEHGHSCNHGHHDHGHEEHTCSHGHGHNHDCGGNYELDIPEAKTPGEPDVYTHEAV